YGFTQEWLPLYLDIMGIMRNQAGRYECKASNDVATPDVKYVNVVVNYPPTIKKTQSSETPVGRIGTLQCDATAVPNPEFEWYRDEKRLSNNQAINIQILGSTTILMIANVTEEDYGNYTCVASNRLGVQNASLFLYKTIRGAMKKKCLFNVTHNLTQPGLTKTHVWLLKLILTNGHRTIALTLNVPMTARLRK
uniref:Ig-like domain-containing protein n=1 Tax=Gouania willdenowi TaxID=441366 RepID=A0A8C5FZL3_GOUWI